MSTLDAGLFTAAISQNHSSSGLSEVRKSNTIVTNSQPLNGSVSVTSAFSRLIAPSNEDVITGTTTPELNETSKVLPKSPTSLFDNASLKSEVNRKGLSVGRYRQAGMLQRVSTAEEALPNGDLSPLESPSTDLGKAEIAALQSQLATAENREKILIKRLDAVGSLVETSCHKIHYVIEEMEADVHGSGQKSTKELIRIQELLRQCLSSCGLDADVQAALLQSAMMEEGEEALEPQPSSPLPVVRKNLLAAVNRDQSVSPASDSSDYSMVDANDDFDLLEGCDKKTS